MLDSLFAYQIDKQEDGVVEANVTINAGHEIFTGHFPGYPIMPGVCMVQIVEQIFSDFHNRKFLLSNAKSIKFLSLFNPREVSQVKASIQYKPGENNQMQISATLFTDEITYFKLKGQLRERESDTGNTKV